LTGLGGRVHLVVGAILVARRARKGTVVVMFNVSVVRAGPIPRA
jgi:hypothetical protein